MVVRGQGYRSPIVSIGSVSDAAMNDLWLRECIGNYTQLHTVHILLINARSQETWGKLMSFSQRPYLF